MTRRLLIFLLLLLFQRVELFAKAGPLEPAQPHRVRQIHLSASEANLLKAQLTAQGVQVIEGNRAQELYAQAQVGATPQEPPQDATSDSASQALESEGLRRSDGSAPKFNFQFGLFRSIPYRGGGKNDPLAMVFVIIGFVVVFAFIAYSVHFLYRWLAHGYHLEGWVEYGAGAWGFSNGTEFGGMRALRFGLGMKGTGFSWGLGGEFGRIEATVTHEVEGLAEEVHLSGSYIIVGPRLDYRTDWGPSLTLEMLSGDSAAEEVNTITKAMLGLRWALRNGAYIGASTGSLMVSLEKDLGYIRHKNPYNWLSGLEAGWRF